MRRLFLDIKGLKYFIEKLLNREVQGKGLSSNDFTDEDKQKLDALASGAGTNLKDVDGKSIVKDDNGIISLNYDDTRRGLQKSTVSDIIPVVLQHRISDENKFISDVTTSIYDGDRDISPTATNLVQEKALAKHLDGINSNIGSNTNRLNKIIGTLHVESNNLDTVKQAINSNLSKNISNTVSDLLKLGTNYNSLYSVATTLKNFIESADTSDETINRWKEVENFLSGITDTETLTGLLENLKTEIQNDTNIKDVDGKSIVKDENGVININFDSENVHNTNVLIDSKDGQTAGYISNTITERGITTKLNLNVYGGTREISDSSRSLVQEKALAKHLNEIEALTDTIPNLKIFELSKTDNSELIEYAKENGVNNILLSYVDNRGMYQLRSAKEYNAGSNSVVTNTYLDTNRIATYTTVYRTSYNVQGTTLNNIAIKGLAEDSFSEEVRNKLNQLKVFELSATDNSELMDHLENNGCDNVLVFYNNIDSTIKVASYNIESLSSEGTATTNLAFDAIGRAHRLFITRTGITKATQSIYATSIPDKAITTPKLADNAVVGAKIVDKTIVGMHKIANGSVVTDNLANLSVTNEKLAGGINGNKILGGSIGSGLLGTGAVNLTNVDSTITARLIPTGGDVGQILTKTNSGAEWVDSKSDNPFKIFTLNVSSVSELVKNNLYDYPVIVELKNYLESKNSDDWVDRSVKLIINVESTGKTYIIDNFTNIRNEIDGYGLDIAAIDNSSETVFINKQTITFGSAKCSVVLDVLRLSNLTDKVNNNTTAINNLDSEIGALNDRVGDLEMTESGFKVFRISKSGNQHIFDYINTVGPENVMLICPAVKEDGSENNLAVNSGLATIHYGNKTSDGTYTSFITSPVNGIVYTVHEVTYTAAPV